MHANIKPYDMLSAMLNETQCSLTSLINRSKEDTIQIKIHIVFIIMRSVILCVIVDREFCL